LQLRAACQWPAKTFHMEIVMNSFITPVKNGLLFLLSRHLVPDGCPTTCAHHASNSEFKNSKIQIFENQGRLNND